MKDDREQFSNHLSSSLSIHAHSCTHDSLLLSQASEGTPDTKAPHCQWSGLPFPPQDVHSGAHTRPERLCPLGLGCCLSPAAVTGAHRGNFKRQQHHRALRGVERRGGEKKRGKEERILPARPPCPMRTACAAKHALFAQPAHDAPVLLCSIRGAAFIQAGHWLPSLPAPLTPQQHKHDSCITGTGWEGIWGLPC